MQRSILFLWFLLSAFTFSRADNENLLGYDWAYDAMGNVIGVKVYDGSRVTGDVVIPDTHWGRPVVEISGGAFKGNTSLTSVTLPNTVTKIGDQAFWSCSAMASASIGNSVESIGDDAFQYCGELESIALPNTLKSVGDHFLCSCYKLKTLVVPENLTDIGTYFLHGCESLRTVYLVGSKPRTLGDYPFVSQVQQGKDQVHNCTFYVDSEEIYESYYKNATNWKLIDKDNHDYIVDDGSYRNGGNSYAWEKLPDDIRPYSADWITACYPVDIDARAVFGDKTLVAKMTAAQYKGRDAAGDYVYHIDFNIVESQQMKAHTPYLIKVDPKSVGSAFIVPHSADETSKTDNDLAIEVNIDNQGEDPSAALTTIRMLGTYTAGGRYLEPGEFLFSNSKGNLKFYKQQQGGVERHMGTYRCYWQIIKDNRVVSNAKLGWVANETTGIKAELQLHDPADTPIYNLRGQIVGSGKVRPDALPKGIYIVNGKKVIIK